MGRHRWFWDAFRSRLVVNALLVLVAAIAVVAAVFGPLLVRAVAQFTVQQAVTQAGADGTAVRVRMDFNGEDTGPWTAAATRALSAVGDSGRGDLWQAPKIWTESEDNLVWSRDGVESTLSSRVRLPGQNCDGLTISTGRCPAARGEVAVSAAAAEQAGVAVDDTIGMRTLSTTIGPLQPPSRVKIVGTYDADRTTTPMTRPGGDSVSAPVTADPVVMVPAQAVNVRIPVMVLGRADLAKGIGVQDEQAVRDSVAAVRAAVLRESFTIGVETGLTDLLDRVDEQVRSATVLVAVTEVQALALGVFALAVVLQRIALTRTAEWGIGRLRGVPRGRWYTSIYLEPAICLVVGAVLGYAVGLAAGRWSVTTGLGADTPLEPWRWPVWVAALAVLLAFAVALFVVSSPSLRRPLVELIQQRAEGRRLGTGAAIGQSAVVLLAAATLYQLRFGGVLDSGGSQLGLLAPALLAVTLAIAAVRIAVTLVRRVTAKPPRTLAALIVGRQTARTPSSLNPAMVVAVGTALAVFATQVWLVSSRNQELRSSATVGAPTVLTVQVPASADLLDLVDAADPSGQQAMAVEERSLPSDTGVSRILAVDASRFSALTSWSPEWAGNGDLAALRPEVGAPVILTGEQLTVTVAGVAVKPGVVSNPDARPADPVLVATVLADQQWKTVELGRVAGSAPLTAALPCASGCRLVSIGLLSAGGAAYDASFTITGIGTDQQDAEASKAWLGTGPWGSRTGDLSSADPRAKAVPTPGPDGLKLEVFDRDGGNPALALPPDVVDPLPVLIAPATSAQAFPGVPDSVVGRGLDGQTQLLQVVGKSLVLPRLLDDGVLVDLTLAGKLADPAKGARTDEVWLSADASPQIEQALTAAGVTVTTRQVLTDETRQLSQEPSTRAAAASSYLGFAALALTLVALIAARAAALARRRPDWKSLRDGGLRQTTLRRLAFIEIAVPVAVGVVLGVASGVIGFALAAAKLPLVDLSVPGPPLDLGIAWSAVGLLGGGVLVIVLGISALACWVETRTAGEGRS